MANGLLTMMQLAPDGARRDGRARAGVRAGAPHLPRAGEAFPRRAGRPAAAVPPREPAVAQTRRQSTHECPLALPFLPFALPEIGDEEIAEVVDTLKSGWVTTGPKAKRFEAAFTEYLGDPSLESHRGQLGHRRPAPGARGAGHRPGRRGDHDHAHLHGHRRGGALPRRRRGAGRRRSRHAVHRARGPSRTRSRRAPRPSCRCTTRGLRGRHAGHPRHRAASTA